MSEMEISDKGVLKEAEIPAPPVHPVLKVFGIFFSYLFHPLLLIVWVSLYLLYVNDTIFLGLDSFDRLKVFLRIISTSVLLPLITVLLLKALGFIQSIQLHTQKERIIPYVACITFFFWSYYVARQLHDPAPLKAFLLTLFVSASAALIINNYFKVSMHAIGAGSLLAFFILLLFNGKVESGVPITLAVFIAGITCTSRFIAGKHHPFDIGFGFVLGCITQLICWWITA
ncbi:MAG TPA: phosphatase PAP2 family protein [Lacibacter sp.]|nr:phosphatase PAP2 family protein [Lacibacter sp.]